LLERNAELVWEVRKRLGPATAMIYEIALQKAQEKSKAKGEDLTGNHLNSARLICRN